MARRFVGVVRFSLQLALRAKEVNYSRGLLCHSIAALAGPDRPALAAGRCESSKIEARRFVGVVRFSLRLALRAKAVNYSRGLLCHSIAALAGPARPALAAEKCESGKIVARRSVGVVRFLRLALRAKAVNYSRGLLCHSIAALAGPARPALA